MKRSISLRGALSGAVRTAAFNGKEHLIVPVVALVEGVLHAANAETPELVLAEEFSKVPDGWNGRPVLWDHPSLNGSRVSANSPVVLERMWLGHVFNARVEGKSLKMDAWLDVAACAKLPEGVRMLERVRAGEVIEVSVGAFVDTEARAGRHNGKAFDGVWRNIVPDHLAMLPEGTLGACSVEMGCGAPRAMASLEEIPEPAKEIPMTILEKFRARVAKFIAAANPSDAAVGNNELNEKLHQVLFATQPAFLGVVDVFSAEKQVIFATSPDGNDMLMFRQSFATDADGAVTLEGEPEQVTEKRTFEPTTASTGCGCGGSVQTKTAPAVEENVNKHERVLALIASLKLNGKAVFEACDAAHLETLSDERLKTLEEQAAAKPIDAVPTVAPVAAPVKVEDPKPLTEEQYLASAPESVKAIVAEHKAASAKRRTELLTAMSATKQTIFAEADLAKKSNDELEQLVRLATASAPVDQSGRGTPRVPGKGQDEIVPKPLNMLTAVRQLRGEKVESAS